MTTTQDAPWATGKQPWSEGSPYARPIPRNSAPGDTAIGLPKEEVGDNNSDIREDTQAQDPSQDNAEAPLPWPEGVRIPQEGKPGKRAQKIIKRNQADPANPGFLPKPPPPTSKELAKWTVNDTKAAVKEVQGGRILTMGMIGGSGQTTIGTYLAACLAIDTKADVVYVDGNPADGCGAGRMGMRAGETLTVQDVANNRDVLRWSREEFLAQAPRNNDGVRCIASSPDEDEAGRPIFFAKDCHDVLEIVRSWSEFNYIDCMNKFTCETGLQMLQDTQAIVFSAYFIKPESLWRLGNMIQTVRNHGFVDLVDNHSVVVINAHDAALDNVGVERAFRKFTSNAFEADDDGRIVPVKTFPEYGGPILGVPWNAHIASNLRVSPDKLDDRTLQSFRTINLAVLNRLPKKRGLDAEARQQWRRQMQVQLLQELTPQQLLLAAARAEQNAQSKG